MNRMPGVVDLRQVHAKNASRGGDSSDNVVDLRLDGFSDTERRRPMNAKSDRSDSVIDLRSARIHSHEKPHQGVAGAEQRDASMPLRQETVPFHDHARVDLRGENAGREEVEEYQPGEREDESRTTPLLKKGDLDAFASTRNADQSVCAQKYGEFVALHAPAIPNEDRRGCEGDDEFLSGVDQPASPRMFAHARATLTNAVSSVFASIPVRLILRQHRTFAVFVLSCFLVTTVFGSFSLYVRGRSVQRRVTELGAGAISHFTSAASAAATADLASAQNEFMDASQLFEQAELETETMGTLVVSIASNVPGFSKVRSGVAVTGAGEDIAKAGVVLSGAAERFASLESSNVFAGNPSDLALTDLIVLSRDDLRVANGYLESAAAKLEIVELRDIPDEYREAFAELQGNLPNVVAALANMERSTDLLLEVLGHDLPKTYLFLFQNTAERRGTGGFIGSYGLFRMEKGKVQSLDVGDIYDLDGQFLERVPQTVIPPEPLQAITAEWSLRDANYYADGPTSLAKVASFYEKSGGPTVDGVFTITPEVLEEIIAISGPLSIESANVTLTSENVVAFIRETIELENARGGERPKQILAEITPYLMNALFQAKSEKLLSVWSSLSRLLSERHILLYFRDSALQKRVETQGWSGKVLENDGDYLQVVSQNIGGKKTDAVVEQSIDHDVRIASDGRMTETVTITKRHSGTLSDPDWFNHPHVSYVEVMVPKGSTLLDASGIEHEFRPSSTVDFSREDLVVDSLVNGIEGTGSEDSVSGTRVFEAFGKTVFGNWMRVEPGEVKSLSYTYALPESRAIALSSFFDRSDAYALLVQKQSGTLNDSYRCTVTLEAPWDVVWTHPASFTSTSTEHDGSRMFVLDGDLRHDRVVSLVFEK